MEIGRIRARRLSSSEKRSVPVRDHSLIGFVLQDGLGPRSGVGRRSPNLPPPVPMTRRFVMRVRASNVDPPSRTSNIDRPTCDPA